MDSSDDEEVLLPESVSNYHFVNEQEEPVSFCVLPFRWQDDQNVEATTKQVFLHGVGDDGLQKIYKQVTEWKLELDGIRPVVYVLSKEQKWLQLLKPRKSYEDLIRKILITIQCLHYLRNTSEPSERSLWDHLKKEFSHFEVRPSQADLQDHLPFIREMAQRDEAFANCQLLSGILEGSSRKRHVGGEDLVDTKNSDFINDDDDENQNGSGDGNDDADDSDEEQDCFDSVCAICDNGGELLCCEGRCLRSFHAIKGVDTGSECKTLGYTRAQVKEIQHFMCRNCRFKMHQCFACGKLGSSDRSSGTEVFPCVSATCGHFYHPKCVAKLLHPENDADAIEQEKKIAAGETFICPVHKCLVCKQVENKEIRELQFAVCRRCPRSYHRKCLPSQISFEDSDEDSDAESETIVRAWDNLLPNRILIYCLRHKIDEDLGTPIRNHIKFPDDPDAPEKKKVLLSNKTKVLVRKGAEDLLEDQPTIKKSKLVRRSSPAGENGSIMNDSMSLSRLKKGSTVSMKKDIELSKERTKTTNFRGVELTKPSKSLLRDLLSSKVENASPTVAVKKLIPPPEVDSDTQKRVIALARRSPASSLTLDMFIKQRDIPSTHAYAAKHVDKTVTLGKVEGSIEAIQTALQKVKEDNGSTDNAKAVCEPGIVVQISRWRNKLGVYLSPFLHGLLYTSFGRHFTKIDKLKEIVDRLHWYVQPGDTIVDFCCGANDFSSLMKEKLDATGKKCFYKNFDIIPPKNDFNFTKRDWMKVQLHELPSGSQMIMGLNPPFGVKGALANKFIDKALQFRPKLVILIVPKETERLDRKRGTAYDLIWEDDQKLSGKSFYMPGNVDVNDKQLEQWNVSPPPLYLWSRPDWTSKHMEIAKHHGHLGKASSESIAFTAEVKVPNPVWEEKLEQPVATEKVEASPKPKQLVAAEKVGVSPKSNVKEEEKKEEAVSTEKKESRSSRRNRKRKQRDSRKEASTHADASDMSISRRMESRNEPKDDVREEERSTERTSNQAAASQAANFGDAYDRILSSDLYKEAANNRDDTNRQRTSSVEVNYPLGNILNKDTPLSESIYRTGRSEERYQGYGVGSSYGLPDRSREDSRSDARPYGQPRSSDLLSDIRNYSTPSSTYGTTMSSLGSSSYASLGSSTYGTTVSIPGQSGLLGSSSYGYDSARLSSVTDRYASRLGDLGHGLPSSSINSSTMDKYAPRLDDKTYTRRSSATPETPLLGRGPSYGAPGSWNGSIPRDPSAYPPVNRYPPS